MVALLYPLTWVNVIKTLLKDINIVISALDAPARFLFWSIVNICII